VFYLVSGSWLASSARPSSFLCCGCCRRQLRNLDAARVDAFVYRAGVISLLISLPGLLMMGYTCTFSSVLSPLPIAISILIIWYLMQPQIKVLFSEERTGACRLARLVVGIERNFRRLATAKPVCAAAW